MIQTYDELLQIISKGESRTLEFKKSTAKISEGCKSLVGFLNADGGILLFGITNDHEVSGQAISDKTRQDLDLAINRIEPRPLLDIQYIDIPNMDRKVIAIQTMTDSRKKPYFYDGRAYMRGEAGNRRMTQEEIHALVQLNSNQACWEHQVTEVTLDDLDIDEIMNTVNIGIKNERIPARFTTDDPWQALEHFKLIENNKITNAAVVLFGKEPDQYFPQCLLRLARFKGRDNKNFIDNKRVFGNIFQLLRQSLMFVQTYLPLTSTFPVGQFERHDEFLFPMAAIREALVNAFVHRDYSSHNGSVSLAIYDDRIEIWNMGGLIYGMTVEKMLLNTSMPRNSRIANVLYYHKYFESWGRGVQEILTLCTHAGHPEPKYIIDATDTLLILRSKLIIGGEGKVAEIDILEDHISDLTSRQQELMKILESNKSLSIPDLLELLNNPPTRRTILRDLTDLKNKGFVYESGVGKNIKWSLSS